MKTGKQTKILLSLGTATTLFALAVPSAHGGAFSSDANAPTVSGYDIANPATPTGSDKWFNDGQGLVASAAKGQTFTTPNAPVLFKAITYKCDGANMKAASPITPTIYTVRVGTVSGTTFTQIASEAFSQTFSNAPGSYLTWTLATPVLLAANTTYAVDVAMTTAGLQWQWGIPYLEISGDVYSGGQLYNSGVNGVGGATVAFTNTQDRVFHLRLQHPMAPSPEPGAIVLAGNVTLSWLNLTPNTGSNVWVDVWFGTNSTALTKFVSAGLNTTSQTVNAPAAATYYWRVDSYLNGAPTGDPVTGTLFNFSIGDSDGDGIPDSWMMTYFGHPTGLASDHSRAQDDADGDGLTNLQEYQLGTNPLMADTDGDGVGDWYEVAAAYTDPNNPNSKPAIPYPLPKPNGSTGATSKPVKVFILSGEANMVGEGDVDPLGTNGTLSTIVKQQNKFPDLLDTNGNWVVWSNVMYRGVISALGNGPLTVGYAAGGGQFGPELGFGRVMGYYLNEPVLIIKASQGNRNLFWDLLPPGSPEYTNNGTVYAGYGESPNSWPVGGGPSPYAWYAGKQYDDYFLAESDMGAPAWANTAAYPAGSEVKDNGVVYNCLVAHTSSADSEPGVGASWASYWQVYSVFNVTTILDNFATQYPQWAAQGFEIAGFVWWQGVKDSQSAVYASRYETNLVNFIKTLRHYYENRYPSHIQTNAPWVVGTMDYFGWAMGGDYLTVANAQLAVGDPVKHPEFSGNVKAVETRGYWRTNGPGAAWDWYFEFHNAEDYMLVGDVLGRGMISMLSNGTSSNNASLANSDASGVTATTAALNATLACTGAVYNVVAFWNTVNGGTDAALWTNSAYVGSWTNVASTNLSFTATGLTPNTTYYFTFLATNAVDTLWATNVLSFTTFAPPTITTQPESETLAVGQTASFTVTASGSSPLTFIWRLNGTNIPGAVSSFPGATDSTYFRLSVQTRDSGNYSVVVTNAFGSAVSSNAVLTVLYPPAITAQPQSLAVNRGSNATFTVTASGSAPLAYQWRLNGTNLAGSTRIVGVATNALTLYGVNAGDAGSYSVIVTNPVGAAISTAAVLTVTCPAISLTPTTLPSATAGSAYSQSLTAAGGTPPYALAVTTGSLPAGLNLSEDGNISGTPSIIGTNTFTVMATDANGCAGSQACTLTISGAPPTITFQPQSATNVAGATATFSIGAGGTQPLAYQWRFNETNLVNDARVSGALTNQLVINNLRSSDAGSYSVVVVNDYGSTNSAVAALTVLKAVPVLSWTNPPAIIYGVALGTNQLNATASVPGSFVYSPTNGTVLDAGTNVLSVAFTPSDASSYNSTITNVSLVVLAAPLSVTASNVTRAYGLTNPAFTGTITGLQNGDNITATYTCSAIPNSPPGEYWIIPSLVDSGHRLANYSVITNNGTLMVTCPSITLGSSTLPVALVGVAYNQTLTSSGGASPYNFAVTSGTLPAGLALSPGGALTGSPITAGTNGFTVMATDANGCTGSQVYNLVVAGVAPGITSQPQSTTNVLSTTANFTVSASGSPPIGYQWQFNGTNLVEGGRNGGVNTNHLTISNVQWSDAGGYSVLVTNAFGSATSAVANLTLICPLISVNPATLPSGRISNAYNQTFSATGGAGPCGFAVTAGSLPDGLSLSSDGVMSGTPSTIGSGSFTVTATDTNGCSGSRSYGLVILGLPPSITSQPQSVTNSVWSTAAFTVTATGTAPFSYQWVKNGANLAAQTNSTLLLTNLLGASAGSYWAIVANTYGSVTSAVATLTVLKVTPAVSWASPAAINYGVALGSGQLNASAGVAGSFAYSPPAGTVLTAGTNPLQAVFTPTDLTSFNGSTATVSIVVSRVSLSVTANNATRGYGQPNPALTGTITGIRAGDNITATYSCSATNNSPLGPYPIVPSLVDPNSRLANYNVTINNGTLTVVKAAPVLTWATPSPINYGTALSSNCFNASASVPGSFAYSPPAGTVLDAGTRALSVLFTPSDPANYSSATGGVSLVVVRAPLSLTANNAARAEGQPNPVFSGTLTGVTNGDNITANYTCSANQISPAGTYAIVPSLFDPGSRAGNYNVTLKNGTLLVGAVNDLFANRTTITGVSNTLASSNINATKEPGEPDHAGNAGGSSLWWAWTAPVNGTVTLDTIGSSFYTLLAVYTGDSVSSLTMVAADTASAGNRYTSQLTFPVLQGTTYQIAVDGYAGDTGSIILNLREEYGPPQMVTQPQGQTVQFGNSVIFSATVKGSPPFAYQWRKDGVDLPGATNAAYPAYTNTAYAIASAQTTDSGTYSVAVSNSLGTAISSGALLTVFLRPDNDAYGNASPLFGLTNSVTGNNTYATPDGFEASFFAGRSVWWTWTAPTNGTVVVDTIGSSFDTILAVYTDGASGPVLMTWDDQSGGNNTSLLRFDTEPDVTYYFGVDGSRWAAAGSTYGSIALNLKVLFLAPQITVQPQPQSADPGWSLAFNVAATGTTPLTYQWLLNGAALSGATDSGYAIASVQPGDAGNYSVLVSNSFGVVASSNALLNLFTAPANDLFANSSVINGLTNTVLGMNVGATKEAGEPNHAGNPGGHSVWWSWTAPTNGAVVLDTIGSSFDTLLAVYTGNSVAGLTLVASDDNSGGNLTSKLVFSGTANTTYQIAVDGSYPSGPHGAAYGNIVLHLQQAPQFAPQILSQPQSQAIVTGASVAFAVTSFGLPNPTYQWLWNGTPLAGKTSATLQLNNVATNQAGAYSVLLSNIAGTVSSASAMLRVEKPLNPGFRGNWPGFETGEAEDVYVTNGLAYVATSAGFLVLDVGDPTHPRRVGGYNSDSSATRIAAKDGFVYLLTSSNQISGATLSRFDARNPALPRKVAQYVSSTASDFTLAGDLVCAVDGPSLLVLDTNCSRLGTLTTTNGAPSSVVAAANYAFVAWPGFIGMYSLTNPAAPTAVASLSPDSGQLALWQGYVYAVTGSQRVVQLRVLDPGNLQRPQVGLNVQVNTLGVAEHQGLAFGTNAAYVATAGFTGNALGIYSLGQPWNPTLVGTSLFADGTPRRVAFADGYVYVANGGTGLKVFDVSDATHPAPVGQFFTAVEVSAVALQGNLAYVLDVNTGFHVLDVSDPTIPFELGAYQSAGGAAAIATKSHYVYLALDAPPTSITVSGPSLEIVDVASPDHPALLGSVTLPSPALTTLPQPGDPSVQVTALAVARNLVLVGSGLNGIAALGIVDVSNPAAPRVTGRFDLQGTAQIARIAFDGRYAYLADSYFGLRILDLADPANPVQIGSLAEPSTTYSVSVQGDLCLLTGFYGTDVVDVSRPNAPVRLASNNASGTLDWLQNTLALGSGPDGIKVYDLVSPTNPLVIGQFAGAYSSVTVQGRYAFAAGDEAGLTILDLGANYATPPAMLDQPANCRVVAGGSASFFAAANGTVPLSYQWRFNGTDIPGATDPLLTLTGVQLAQVGQYSVAVSNSIGFTVSSNAVLSVNIPPTVALTSPQDHQVFRPPATIPLIAEATDDGAVARIAFYNGTSLLGVAAHPPFSFNWSDVPAGVYSLSAVATDNEGATGASAPITLIVTNLPVFQLSRSSYTAYESNGLALVTILRNSGDTAGSINFQTFNSTAQAVNGSSGNYYGVSNQVDFAVGETSKDVPIYLVNDLVYRGLLSFRVTLSNPSSGWSLADPTNALVSIVDDDPSGSTNSFTDVRSALPPPVDRGSLTVALQPLEADGRWRFAWETAWRLGGSTATNLPPGNYSVVFQERAGWVAPLPATNVVSAGANEAVTNYYGSAGGSASGSLGVVIHPSAVVGVGQWRTVENPPGPWLDSGAILTNLPPGPLVIEFSDVTNYSTPASRFVQVAGDQTTLYDVTYLLAPTPAPGEGPRPLANLSAIANTNTPYQFSGQLLTDAGYSSGFVVKDRTVLTAAHALFDPVSLTYASSVWWFFQGEAGEYEPVPQVPRGCYVFGGYASARTNDIFSGHIGPDESSTTTRQQDVAALYFFESAGRGGYGGYLTSDPAGTDWLLSSSLMLLIGYPVETVPLADRGRMHQVGPGYYLFNQIPATSLYRATGLQSYPGNSGGPLCVQAADSLGRPFFLPAGVFLGGSGETIVRNIDLDVVDLITRADTSSSGGGNSTGGGVITLSFGSGSGLLAYIQVHINPPTALLAGVGWRLQGRGSQYYTDFNHTEVVSPGDNPVIEFSTVAGWNGPADRNISVTLGATTIIDALYTRAAQLVVSPATAFSSSGYAGGPFNPPAITYTLTNPGSDGLNWSASKAANWLTLTASSGVLAAGASANVTVSVNANANSLAPGSYSDTLGFTNLSNGLGNAAYPVNLLVSGIHPLVQLVNVRLLTNGAVAMALQGVPGGVYSIVGSTNLLNPLSNWAEVLRLTNSSGQTVFTNPPPPASPQFYRAKEL